MMKTLILALTLVSASAMAQVTPWRETFKLPEGTTYRARTAGYDCGTFGNKYVAAPESFRTKGIEFKQLSADKDLNKFLFEASFPSTEGKECIYGIFLDRNRDDKTLDFTHSLIKTEEGNEDFCLETKNFIDTELRSVAYEGSKRGLRYVAVEIVKDQVNDVCDTNSVRVVFDRRFAE
jgi:hypothetical protein